MARPRRLDVSEQLEGRRPVLAALRAGRVRRIYLAAGARHAIVDEIRAEAASRRVPVEEVPRSRVDALSVTGKHQGVVAEAETLSRRDWERAIADASAAGRTPFVVALDGIQDPGNLGALVRSAAAFGADAVLVPQDRAAPMTETASKAAAGALEVVPVTVVRSLQSTIERARELGCWVVALAEEGETEISKSRVLAEPLVLVVGAEGRGVSRTLRNAADELVNIPTSARFTTLNASAAGAIAMHAVHTARLRLGESDAS